MTENETSNDVSQNVKSIIEESSSELPDVAIDRAHRIGKAYSDKTSGGGDVKAKLSVYDYRHRAMFDYNRKNLKRNVKVKWDLTKNRYFVFSKAMQ